MILPPLKAGQRKPGNEWLTAPQQPGQWPQQRVFGYAEDHTHGPQVQVHPKHNAQTKHIDSKAKGLGKQSQTLTKSESAQSKYEVSGKVFHPSIQATTEAAKSLGEN